MSMRQLKEQSGRTLRQLEKASAAHGKTVARSTLADVLRRDTLPRTEVLAAFVRACGAEDQLAMWLQARERLAVEQHVPADIPSTTNTPVLATPKRRALAAAVVLLIAVATAVLLTTLPASDPTSGQNHDTGRTKIFSVPSAGGWAHIRPAQAPEMCLTEGRAQSVRYQSAIAAQIPCEQPGGPRTFLEPVGADATYIKWEHPVDKGMGCLTVMDGGTAKNLLEPQNECSDSKSSQQFRIEPTASGANTYRLRRAGTDFCIAMSGNAIGAEAHQVSCSAENNQHFLIDLDRTG
jgi:hypothetical protein